MSRPSSGYRKDIDGLRAVSVLAVILYHLDERLACNGFIGVDIFFVISGFLITGIIFDGLEETRFSLFEFYLRRTKRILPVFYLVVAGVLAFGSLEMLPQDLKALGKSSLAGAFSASNIYFWFSRDADYFARSSDLLPLLHTWSLGVEEQFYLVWPLTLAFLRRRFRLPGIVAATLLLVIASFLLSQFLLPIDRSFAYYMLPTRSGELLAGALALFASRGGLDAAGKRAFREGLSLAGLSLLLFSLFYSGLWRDFPGLNALYPCLGAAFVLYSGGPGNTFATRCLSYGPLVYIGRISYSLYLWHWPILAFSRYIFTSLDPALMAFDLAAISALAMLSYHFVETPFRTARISARKTFGFLFLLPASAIAAVSLVLYASNGLDSVISGSGGYREAFRYEESRLQPAYQSGGVCQTQKMQDTLFTSRRCLLGDTARRAEALLLGDSHAAHYAGLLDELGKRQGFSFRNIEMGNCPPVFKPEVEYGKPDNRADCREFRSRLRKAIEAYQVIFIGGIWSEYGREKEFLRDFGETVDDALSRGKTVVILGQVPMFESYDRNCLLRNHRSFAIDCVRRAASAKGPERAMNRELESFARTRPGVRYFDVRELLCQGDTCSPYRDGVPFYFDNSHLSYQGSIELGDLILPEALHGLGKIAGVGASESD